MNTIDITQTNQIRSTIDDIVFGDKNKQSEWSQMIAEALIEKRYHRLSEFLSSGKGFNDKTKKAFCLLLDVKPVYSKKGIDSLIAKHCQVNINTLFLEREIHNRKLQLRDASAALIDTYANGSDLVNWVNELHNNGFDSLLTKGRKSYLVNINASGYDLKKKLIKNYAATLIDVNKLESQLKA
jgi:hypothetical protein